ncbi:MAG: DegQ family serine endoprotease [Proteobacteria bacterium]|nr:DegQ family serine endoprotease [Pseudomonadota bacterium]
MTQQARFSKTAVTLAIAAAFGVGAVVADRHAAITNAVAQSPAPAAQAQAAAPAAFDASAVTPVALTTGGTANPAALPNIADLVARNGAAVVEISTEKVAHRTAGRAMPNLPPWFQMPDDGGQQQGPMRGLGSGFIVDRSGIILTNAHVVDGADTVTVQLQDRREFTAKVLGVDKATDIAVLRIDAKNLPVVATGNSDVTRVGDWVVAIGAPFGLENTVTKGIVSAKSRALPGESIVPFIQTDAAVNPGNSGGPLFNLNGEVIGINSQIYSRSGGFQGLSFAIPINVALDVKDQIVKNGKVSHGMLGVTIQEVNQDLADNFGLKNPGGALVGTVQKDGPGAKAGLQPGDVITAFNGRPIARSSELPAMVASLAPGAEAKLDVWRDGKSITLDAKVGSRDAMEKVALNEDGAASPGKLGVAVRALTSEEKADAQVDAGVVIEQVTGAAERAGLQPGDVILSINRVPVKNAAQLKELIGKSGKVVALLVQRDDARIFVPVNIG